MNKYIIKSGKRLRFGYTTGTCAVAASKAAAIMLLKNNVINEVKVKLPNNEQLCLKVEDIVIEKNWVSCGIIKDAGDDPDVTHGIKIYSKVKFIEEGIILHGGIGVGKVTKKGLACKVGDYAINPTPRKMIKEALIDVAKDIGYKGGFDVEIFVPKGEEVAKKTFNQRLGIVGGISILGTTGIVEPMSEAALIDTIKLEIDSKIKNNHDILLLSPGNYGVEFLKNKYNLDINLAIKYSNYIGETLDYALYKGAKKVLIVGHVGKLVKIAAGVMNTHSKIADCRQEIFAAHCGLIGANSNVIKKIMDSVTTDEIHEILKENKLEEKVYSSILKKIVYNIDYRLGEKIDVQFIIFSNTNGVLMKTEKAENFINQLGSD